MEMIASKITHDLLPVNFMILSQCKGSSHALELLMLCWLYIKTLSAFDFYDAQFLGTINSAFSRLSSYPFHPPLMFPISLTCIISLCFCLSVALKNYLCFLTEKTHMFLQCYKFLPLAGHVLELLHLPSLFFHIFISLNDRHFQIHCRIIPSSGLS